MKLFKDVSDYLPGLTIIFIFWSLCSISSYFSIFNIDVITYTSVNEIPVLFFYNFLELIFDQLVLAVFFLVFYIVYRLLHRSQLRPLVRMRAYPHKRVTIISLLALLVVICITERAFYVRSYFASAIPSTYDELAFVCSICLVWYILRRDKFIKYFNIIFLYYILFFGFVLADVGFEKAYYVQKYGSKEQYTFRYQGEEIVCDTALCFVGKTNDYLFLYDKHDKQTLIYEKDKVDSLVVRFNQGLAKR